MHGNYFKATIAGLFAAAALLGPGTVVSAQEPQHRRATASVSGLKIVEGGAAVGDAEGAAVLTRDGKGVTVSIHAADLERGHVYMAWWIIFNNPSACLSTPCSASEEADNPASERSILWATGFIAGGKGVANVSARLDRRDTPGLVVAGRGLTKVQRAEIHIGLVDHGPVDPATIVEEMSTPGPVGRAAIFLPE